MMIPEGVYVYSLALVFLFVLINIYFRIAERFEIIDVPNERSSHKEHTIRGGGIIFWLSLVLYGFYSNFQYPYFLVGMSLVGGVSFIDDIKPLPYYVRMIAQFIGIGLLYSDIGLYESEPIWVLLSLAIIMVGTVNAYNFMDGINGITGLYSLVTLSSLWYVNKFELTFVDGRLMGIVCASVIVFLFYNLRKKARCFAGDVGSVTIAYIVLFFLLNLIFEKGYDLYYILFLSIYGVDTVITIVIRLLKRENIFQAHRSHLYQLLANEGKYSHTKISIGYALVQLVINVMVISVMKEGTVTKVLFSFGLLGGLSMVYLILRSTFRKTLLS